jgi:hypothetical protein
MTQPSAPQPPADGPGRRAAVVLLALLAAAVVAFVVLLVVLLVVGGGDDDDADTTDITSTSINTSTTVAGTTTTSDSTSTSTSTSTTTSAATTTSTTVAPETTPPLPPAADTATAVWPWVDSDVRYDDPVEAARGFALDFIGFTDPLIGEFRQGDSRSGEVEVRSIETFAPTTVFVRQLGPDDSWWVLGSATENIVVETPDALAAIASPLTVSGRSSAFEGTVAVEIRADGVEEPIFESFVTGGAFDELGPFVEVFDWPNPGAGSGAIVFQTTSSDDGRVWEAGVFRVHFAAR